jgi:hypothetical protein
MTDAGGRPMLDADRRVMELPGYVDPFIESSTPDPAPGTVRPDPDDVRRHGAGRRDGFAG